jgi:hypothetical protein
MVYGNVKIYIWHVVYVVVKTIWCECILNVHNYMSNLKINKSYIPDIVVEMFMQSKNMQKNSLWLQALRAYISRSTILVWHNLVKGNPEGDALKTAHLERLRQEQSTV